MQRHPHKKWFRLQRRLRRSLRKSPARRLLGKRIFRREIWRFGRREIAGGLALGLFVGFTPTMPFQTLLAAAGAFLLRVNLPIAVLAASVTNPLTAIPIYTAAWNCGRSILEDTAFVQHWAGQCVLQGASGSIIRHSLYLTTGSLIFATTASAIGYFLGVCLTSAYGRLRHERTHSGNDTT